MSQEQLKAFMEKVKEDKELQGKLAALPKDDLKAAQEAGVAIANELGYDVKMTDVRQQHGELDNKELEQVAGGGGEITFGYTPCLAKCR